jgi:lysophospholipase L1-like esterase
MKFTPPVHRALPPFLLAGLLLLAPANSRLAPAQTTNAPAQLPAALRYPANPDLLPGNGPAQKWDQFPRVWSERRTEFWQHRQQDQGAVIFLGDSITQGWGDLARVFSGIKAANRGIGGDTTRGVLFRLKEDVLDEHPAAVVLLIGVNDLGNGGKPDDAPDNIRLILAALKKANPRMPVVICKVMPSNESLAPKIQTLNRLVDDLVNADPNWIRCDTWSIYANPDGTCKPEEFPDRLHPNQQGYAKWKAALKPILDKLELGAQKVN